MENDCITIRQLRHAGLPSCHCPNDDLLFTRHVEGLEVFRHPCRLDATLVLVCRGGTMDCSINLKRYHIASGTVAVCLTGDIIQLHAAENLEAYAVAISAPCLESLHIDFRQRAGIRIGVRRHAVCRIPQEEMPPLKPYYELLLAAVRTPRPEQAEVLQGLVRAFSYTVISLMHTYGQPEEQASSLRGQQLFDRFISLLMRYHCRERSVQFYAAQLCLTPNYLSGVIKECSGRSALEWINAYVITEAQLLLKHTDGSIQQIAYRLHFVTQSAFGKYFKQQTGISPKAYRNGDSRP